MADKDPSTAPENPPAQEKPMSGTRTDPGGTGGTRGASAGETGRPPLHRRVTGGGGGAVTAARKRAVGLLAGIVSAITTIIVLILVVHIVFVAFEANAANDLVSRISGWADDLAWQFKDVFQPENPKARIAVNYGLAALVYLIIGRVVAALIRRLG